MSFQLEAQSCVPRGLSAPRNGGSDGCRAPGHSPISVEEEVDSEPTALPSLLYLLEVMIWVELSTVPPRFTGDP